MCHMANLSQLPSTLRVIHLHLAREQFIQARPYGAEAAKLGCVFGTMFPSSGLVHRWPDNGHANPSEEVAQSLERNGNRS
jgi:hypothetical protein